MAKKSRQAKGEDRIRVRATQSGLYGQLRETGAEFHIESEEDFHPSWMEHVDDEGLPVEDSPVLKAHKQRENDRVLRIHQQQREMERAGVPPVLPYPDEDAEHPGLSPTPGLKRTDDLGVYSRDGVLQKETTTGSPIVEPGAVGRPGQDQPDRPQPFDARHDAQQDLSQPHQLRDGTAKLPHVDDKKGTRAADKKAI